MAELLDKRGGCWSESLPLLTTPATANQNLHKHWNNNFSKYDAGWQDKQVCKTNARLKVYKYNRDYPTSILFFFKWQGGKTTSPQCPLRGARTAGQRTALAVPKSRPQLIQHICQFRLFVLETTPLESCCNLYPQIAETGMNAFCESLR